MQNLTSITARAALHTKTVSSRIHVIAIWTPAALGNPQLVTIVEQCNASVVERQPTTTAS
jgi:hypothetical protein